MANYKEVGIGIASALASEHTPNPLPLTFKGQSLPEATRIVSAVLDECGAADITLDKVELDAELYRELRLRVATNQRLLSNPDLHCEVRFLRPS